MKKAILIITVVLTSFVANAQSTNQNQTKKAKTEYSYLWGLFKSDGYAKEKTNSIVVEKPKFSSLLEDTSLDKTKYEQKSILWGAIQWTEKKKSLSPIKPQSNEN